MSAPTRSPSRGLFVEIAGFVTAFPARVFGDGIAAFQTFEFYFGWASRFAAFGCVGVSAYFFDHCFLPLCTFRRDARQQSRLFRPLKSIADTQPQLQPALLRLSAMICHYFTRAGFCLFCSPHGNDQVI